jgi:hypothetical protein
MVADEPLPIEANPNFDTELPFEEATIAQRAIASSVLTASDLILVCALGIDANIAGLAARFPTLALPDLIALHAAAAPFTFIEALDPKVLAEMTAHDLILLHSNGCDAEAVNILRTQGYTVAEVVSFGVTGVPLLFIQQVIANSDRPLSAAALMRLNFAGVDPNTSPCFAGMDMKTRALMNGSVYGRRELMEISSKRRPPRSGDVVRPRISLA